MDNMIHAFNKVTNRNQYKVPRKIKRRAELASKRIIKQDRPAKKVDEWLDIVGLKGFGNTPTYQLSGGATAHRLEDPAKPIRWSHYRPPAWRPH